MWQAAREFRISKSTVHKDVTERIAELKPRLAKQVKHVLKEHGRTPHPGGGLATKRKYSRAHSG